MYDLDLDQDHLKASLVPTVFEAQVHLLDFSLKFSPIVPTVGIIKKIERNNTTKIFRSYRQQGQYQWSRKEVTF